MRRYVSSNLFSHAGEMQDFNHSSSDSAKIIKIANTSAAQDALETVKKT